MGVCEEGLYVIDKVNITPDNIKTSGSRVWYVPLTLGFVKVTRGYIKKAEPKPCLCILNNQITRIIK